MKRTTIVNILLVFTGLFAGLVFSSLHQCTDEVMRQGIALQRLLTYHFLQDAENNTVTIYHGSEIPDQSWEIDGWTIVLRSLKQIRTVEQLSRAIEEEYGYQPKGVSISEPIPKRIDEEQKGLVELSHRNNTFAMELAGYLLLNEAEEAGMKIIRLIEQTTPDYRYLGLKYQFSISEFREASEELLETNASDKNWFEDIALQYQSTRINFFNFL